MTNKISVTYDGTNQEEVLGFLEDAGAPYNLLVKTPEELGFKVGDELTRVEGEIGYQLSRSFAK